MMRWFLAFLLIALPFQVLAAPVVVKSGEHDGFTRLVLEYEAPVDWQLGRTSDGYALQLAGATPAYDLSVVFDIIGKGRLAAIWVDPATEDLRIGIGCTCHAIPFEFRPGIIVIDLRDGPPPKGSSFELALDGSKVGNLAARPIPKPKARPAGTRPVYDWTKIAQSTTGLPAPDTPPPGKEPAVQVLAGNDPPIQALRQSLLRQLSRGAAQGVVDMKLPVPQGTEKEGKPYRAIKVHVGGLPGIEAGTGFPDHGDVASDGAKCVPETELDVSSWGDDRAVFEQMAEAMSGLTGEFDKPDAMAVKRAVRFNLHLGFGAETFQLLRAFPADPADAAHWKSMALILDGETDPAPAFAGLANCAGPAALWALLTDPAPTKGTPVNTQAVLLAFSALPAHLRRQLGSEVAERFIATEDLVSARAVQDAVLRAPGDPGPKVDLLQARLDMATGDPKAAALKADQMLKGAGPGSGEALIALTEAQVAQNLPMESRVAQSLAAMLKEHVGTAEEASYQRAATLASAASGNFKEAFAQPDLTDATRRDTWRLLARLGTDDAILEHAILPPDEPMPAVEAESKAVLGERLLGLGFPAAALRWLTPVETTDALLLAKVHLALLDPQAALNSLAGREDPAAMELLARARELNREDGPAAKAYAALGETDAGWRAAGRAQDWAALAASGPEPWKDAAASIVLASRPTDVNNNGAPGSLAAGHQIVENSAATRKALDALLAAVPAPAQNQNKLAN